MSWPAADLATGDLDAAGDSPATARAMLARLVSRVKAVITARGRPNGVCDLDSAGRVPAARLGGGQANGVATLDSARKIPLAQLGLVMTAAERAKLAGIETGARKDQTGAEIRGLLDRTLGGSAWRTAQPSAVNRVVQSDWASGGRGATSATLSASISSRTLTLDISL